MYIKKRSRTSFYLFFLLILPLIVHNALALEKDGLTTATKKTGFSLGSDTTWMTGELFTSGHTSFNLQGEPPPMPEQEFANGTPRPVIAGRDYTVSIVTNGVIAEGGLGQIWAEFYDGNDMQVGEPLILWQVTSLNESDGMRIVAPLMVTPIAATQVRLLSTVVGGWLEVQQAQLLPQIPSTVAHNNDFEQGLEGWASADKLSIWSDSEQFGNRYAMATGMGEALQQMLVFPHTVDAPQITLELNVLYESGITPLDLELQLYDNKGERLLNSRFSIPPVAAQWQRIGVYDVELPVEKLEDALLSITPYADTDAVIVGIDNVSLWQESSLLRLCDTSPAPASPIASAMQAAIMAHLPSNADPFSMITQCNIINNTYPWMGGDWLLDAPEVTSSPDPARIESREFYVAIADMLRETDSTFVLSTLEFHNEPVVGLGGDTLIEYYLAPSLRYLHNSRIGLPGPKPWVRLLHSCNVGCGNITPQIWDQLISQMPQDQSTWNVNVAITTVGEMPFNGWNHSKIAVRDRKWAIVGGQNWEAGYVDGIEVTGDNDPTDNVLYDLSMKLIGDGADAAYRYFDMVWHERGHEFNLLTMCNYEWGATQCLAGPSSIPLPPPPINSPHNVMALGRGYHTVFGYPTSELDQTADYAVIAAFNSAQESIFISQHQMALFDLGGSGGWTWVNSVLDALADAAIRGVEINIVVSDRWGLGSSLTATPVEVYTKIHQRIDARLPVGVSLQTRWDAHNKVSAAPFRATTDVWVDRMLTHNKFWMVDEQVFFIGSQNLYPSAIYADGGLEPLGQLNEFGFAIDDASLAAEVKQEFWDPVWTASTNEVIWGYSNSPAVCPMETGDIVPELRTYWQGQYFADNSFTDPLMVRYDGSGFLDMNFPLTEHGVDTCGLPETGFSADWTLFKFTVPTAGWYEFNVNVLGAYEIGIIRLFNPDIILSTSRESGYWHDSYRVYLENNSIEYQIRLRFTAAREGRVQLTWHKETDPLPLPPSYTAWIYHTLPGTEADIGDVNDYGAALGDRELVVANPARAIGRYFSTGVLSNYEWISPSNWVTANNSTRINNDGVAVFHQWPNDEPYIPQRSLIKALDRQFFILPGVGLDEVKIYSVSETIPQVAVGFARFTGSSAFDPVVITLPPIGSNPVYVTNYDMVPLPTTPPPSPGVAWIGGLFKDVNAEGTIFVGKLEASTTLPRGTVAVPAYMDDDETWHTLPFSEFFAKIVNVHGESGGLILGTEKQYTPLISPFYSWIWDTHTGSRTYLPQTCSSVSATGINSYGHVVGGCSNGNSSYAFYWPGHATMPLINMDTLLGDTQWELHRMDGINNFGDMIGEGLQGGEEKVFRLFPDFSGPGPWQFLTSQTVVNPQFDIISPYGDTRALVTNSPVEDIEANGQDSWHLTVILTDTIEVAVSAFGQFPLQFELIDPVSGMTIDPQSGIFTWQNPVLGTQTVTIRLTDAGGGHRENQLTITVEEVTTEELDTNGMNCRAESVNDQNDVVGSCDGRATLWPGTGTVRDTQFSQAIAPYAQSAALAINYEGAITGWLKSTQTSAKLPFLYVPIDMYGYTAGVHILPLPNPRPCNEAVGYAINNAGVIAGTFCPSGSQPIPYHYGDGGFVWVPGWGEIGWISAGSAGNQRAYDVNNNGLVLLTIHGELWTYDISAGDLTAHMVRPGYAYWFDSYIGVNDNNLVVGNTNTVLPPSNPPTPPTPAHYLAIQESLGTNMPITFLPETCYSNNPCTDSYAVAVNAQGHIVGWAWNDQNPNQPYGFIIVDGQMKTYPQLTGLGLDAANPIVDLNNNGSFVANTANNGGTKVLRVSGYVWKFLEVIP